jgi:PAS domain S-box-containing protein
MSDQSLADELSDMSAQPIHVLLVDDDRQWAELVASDIESEAEDIDVTIAGSAHDCLETLENRNTIDCIVSDYQMPGTNGIELLKEIRKSRPQLPFLLVTSQGSELVAARAIDAGVTDYLIKDLGIDQGTQFVDKIETAINHYRLQQAIEESEQRYRTVTEQSRDGVAILQHGRVLFCNDRLAELTGRNRETLSDSDIVTEVVYHQDRNQVREILDDWLVGDNQPHLHETRLVRPDGTVRHCELTGSRVDYNGEPATLVSIRDVSEREQRERELRWERELNRTIQETLIDSRTRDSLERQVTEQLQRHGYALAWIGEQSGTELVPRAVGGDRRYIEGIDRSLEHSGQVSEPSIWAVQSGDAQFLQQFVNRPATEWCEIATGYNYQSGAGIPLVYNNISYGVLAVYHEQPNRFDETERQLLTELADTVAFAIHSLETQGALAADQTVEVTLQVSGGYYLTDLAHNGIFRDCEEVRVVGTTPLGEDGVLQYVELEGWSITPVQDAIDSHPDVQETTTISEKNPSRLQVTIKGQTPEAQLASQGVVVNGTTVERSGATIEFVREAKEDVRSTVQPLEERFGTVSVLSVSEREQRPVTGHGLPTETLTEKQLTALKAAYYNGFFDQPRNSSASEVADSLDVSHSTFLRHLRAAQKKVFEAQFD